MCGISGLFDLSRGFPAGALERMVGDMAAPLAHRGPDGDGIWVDEAAGIALGHRRLAVIDLSPAGAQPMTSADGRFVIVYNGEIYNAQDMARELAAAGGPALRGHCDTEVLLEACARWGVEEATRRTVGMFAFALWDKRERKLALGRDRLGIKPLYWGRAGRTLFFASELKAIARAPGFSGTRSPDALAEYFRLGYVPAPATVYEGIFKLDAGHILEVGLDGVEARRCYWDLRAIAAAGSAAPDAVDPREAVEALDALLRDAVRCRLAADVPLGAFLSGGIDSSAVVSLMQAESTAPVKTFTVGFAETGFNEAPHAKAVAAHLGTDHSELMVTSGDALDVIPRLAGIYDEPFADASAVPMFLVSQLARDKVTVALSGDGGDELFAGYDRYRVAGLARLGWMSGGLRRGLGWGLGRVPPGLWDALARPLPERLRPPAAGDKMAKLARVFGADDDDAVYRAVTALWADPERLVVGARAAEGIDPTLARDIPNFLSRMQYMDTAGYLPDDILVKLDRASMASSLEARVPLLDHRVVEFAWRLPARFKRRLGATKWLLRRVLDQYLPRHLVDRPKMGFGVPVGAWLRGPLRDWAEALLDPTRIRDEGLLDGALVAQHWREHLSGRRNWSYRLWAVLMFQAWAEKERS
jgi:asparagine synthase (glutamine-hydrolysing)